MISGAAWVTDLSYLLRNPPQMKNSTTTRALSEQGSSNRASFERIKGQQDSLHSLSVCMKMPKIGLLLIKSILRN